MPNSFIADIIATFPRNFWHTNVVNNSVTFQETRSLILTLVVTVTLDKPSLSLFFTYL